ncbi:hypothetical protein G7046_g5906 [Stylonectria norvegica]|nr:hypothetical protein G7046_g5906 [Stylonectria norvegica]
MATTSAEQAPTASEQIEESPTPKFKAYDLPLPSATRAAIESLAHSFKKEGAYDSIRKQVWDKFEASDYEAQVTKSILEVAEQELERNPQQLLTLDRRKAAALIDGALERSGVYHKAEAVIGHLIDVGAIEERIRETRRADIGEEAAEAERIKGSKTDEEYAADTEARKGEREGLRDELRQKEAAIEEEKRRIVKEERKKEEREREQAELKRQEERDERRRKREKEREEREKQRDLEREQRHKERGRHDDREFRDRDRSRDRDRDRDQGRDRDRERDSRRREKEDVPKDLKEKLTKEDHDRLEQEALADLLRESSKTTHKKPEMEIDSTLAPPPRKTGPASAINPIRRDSPRVRDQRKPSDVGLKPDRGSSRTPAESKVPDVKIDKPTRSDSRTVNRDRERPSEVNDRPKRDRRSKSPQRDGSRSRVTDRRERSRSRVRRDRTRSRARRDERRERSRSRPKYDHYERSRSRRRDGNRSRARVDRRERSRSRARPDRRDRSRDRREPSRARLNSDRRDRSRSRTRRDRSRSREVRIGAADHYDPRERDRKERSPPRRRSRDRARDVDRDKDRDRERPRDRDRDRKSRSRSRPVTAVVRPPSSKGKDDLEEWKREEVKKREKEAKAYLAAQKDARAKGLPIPGLDDRKSSDICLEPEMTEGEVGQAAVVATGIGTERGIRSVTETATEIENAEIEIGIGPGTGKGIRTAIGTEIAMERVATEIETGTETGTAIVIGTEIGTGTGGLDGIAACPLEETDGNELGVVAEVEAVESRNT